MAVVSVAVDVQGAAAAKPFADAARAAFPTLVDSGGALGARFGVNYVPFTVLLDAEGRLVRGPRYFNGRAEDAYDEFTRWLVQGDKALATAPVALPFDTAGFRTKEATLRFDFAAALYSAGNREGALRQMRAASRLEPSNFIVLKQIWAIENPDRFYGGPVDFAWQEERLKERSGGK